MCGELLIHIIIIACRGGALVHAPQGKRRSVVRVSMGRGVVWGDGRKTPDWYPADSGVGFGRPAAPKFKTGD